MIWQLLPWKFLIRRAAKAHGFIDPVSFLARVRSFAQPSEVKEPMTLVRASIVFQARGLINARAIQFNLDWVWPYWVQRQFNPADRSFIPRGFAPTHVNLTQRNWTAVGLPEIPLYPLVDPRGLVTPLHDGWSLDFAALAADGRRLLPSRIDAVDQSLEMTEGLAVRTTASGDGLGIASRVTMVLRDDGPVLRISVEGRCGPGGRLAVSLRPYNPEGVQFVEKIAVRPERPGWRVDGSDVNFDRRPDAHGLSNYALGDVLSQPEDAPEDRVACDIGMATAAAYFDAGKDGAVSVGVEVPLATDMARHFKGVPARSAGWGEALAGSAHLEIAGERIRFLFEAAKRTLTLLSAHEIYPGPFTYRRFWFRDAVLMGNAMLGLNMVDRLGRHLRGFPDRQKADGFFESQEGEWDSNGQVLWLIDRWRNAAGSAVDGGLLEAVWKGADWIVAKRGESGDNPLCRGLLPPGFSAEHLGPNDYYYWDDFWSIAGLGAARALAEAAGRSDAAAEYARRAGELHRAVFDSIAAIPERRARGCIPASPFRRMDAGAVGSMVADYPLMITAAGDARIMNTLAYILENCFFGGGFFQDMIHSGINVYLTLDLAQTMLRAGDRRFVDLLETAADLATTTGNWPEAVHPFSGGGCMGDGQHGWAAAEWVMLVKNIFVREEGRALVLGSGLLPRWLGESAFFGPTATPHGPVSLSVDRVAGRVFARLDAQWHKEAPATTLAVPGYRPLSPFAAGVATELEPM